MTARKLLKRFGGFTLVELLIVIAILGIIALIVIAAINPIEQANRARDTGMKSDASQLLSAIDRYFAVKSEFPWVSQLPASYTNDSAFGFSSIGSYLVGLCADDGTGADDCNNNGVLIVDEELKPEFRNRKFIDAHVDDTYSDQLAIGKEAADQSVYVCYVPMSKSNRTKACADNEVYQINETSGAKSPYDCSSAQPTSWTSTTNLAGQYYVCIPE